jgi:hypothetical protein
MDTPRSFFGEEKEFFPALLWRDFDCHRIPMPQTHRVSPELLLDTPKLPEVEKS